MKTMEDQEYNKSAPKCVQLCIFSNRALTVTSRDGPKQGHKLSEQERREASCFPQLYRGQNNLIQIGDRDLRNTHGFGAMPLCEENHKRDSFDDVTKVNRRRSKKNNKPRQQKFIKDGEF